MPSVDDEPKSNPDSDGSGGDDASKTAEVPKVNEPDSESTTANSEVVADDPNHAEEATVAMGAVTLANGISTSEPSHTDDSEAESSGTTAPITDSADSEPAEAVVKKRRPMRILLWILAIPVVLLLLLLVAWGIDTATSGDQVARNTEVAGAAVGGMSASELNSTLDELDDELPSTAVAIDTGDLLIESTAGDLGITIDTDSTADSVMDMADSESLVTQPFTWAKSFFSPLQADVAVSVDEAQLDKSLTNLEGDNRVIPIEPTLIEQDGRMAVQPGVNGTMLTAAAVIDGLPSSLGDVSREIVVTTDRTVTNPAAQDEQVQVLADQANTILDSSVTVIAGDDEFVLEGGGLLGGLTVDASGDLPRVTLSQEVISLQLENQVPGATSNPTGVTFDIQGGVPVPIAGSDAQVCCGDGAANLIVDAFLAGEPTVEVPTSTVTAAEGVEWASGLGVNQVVGEFTTNYSSGQSRVTNIHRISDLTRGVLIPPGGTWSVNDHVGRRTVAKGFAEGGVIHDGEFTTDIGGGVSQYATTLFNAAFFAGVDIPEYKMHSKYISRYPYGREATLDYPSVDLEIHNDTPYGIVVWPTYTSSSITAQLWSTPYGRGEQTSQSKSSGCGSVRTERTTTFPDGQQQVDNFSAAYDCD